MAFEKHRAARDVFAVEFAPQLDVSGGEVITGNMSIIVRDQDSVDVTSEFVTAPLQIVNGTQVAFTVNAAVNPTDQLVGMYSVEVSGQTSSSRVLVETVAFSIVDFSTVVLLPHIRDYLEIDHNAYDRLLHHLIRQAHGRFETWTSRHIFAKERTVLVDGGMDWLTLPAYPVSTTATLTVTDTNDGTVLVSGEDYFLLAQNGWIRGGEPQAPRRWFQGLKRYQVTWTGGLELDPDWNDRIKPDLAGSFRDFVVDKFENRTPGAREVRLGGGVATSYFDDSIPDRVLNVWHNYREILF